MTHEEQISLFEALALNGAWSNAACIACIAGLFAIRRFLVRRSELRQEMVDSE